MHAEGMQFYCPSSTYTAIVLLGHFLLLNYRAISDTSAKQSEAHVLKGCNYIAPQVLIKQLHYYYFIFLLE